jgi:hypothetical protein
MLKKTSWTYMFKDLKNLLLQKLDQTFQEYYMN